MSAGHFTDYSISSEGVVSGTWVFTHGDETPTTTLVTCECDRSHMHTKQELLNNIPHNACGLFLSLAHPIQGTTAMEIVNLPGSGVAVFASRKISDVNISASSLLTLALVTLKNASELKSRSMNVQCRPKRKTTLNQLLSPVINPNKLKTGILTLLTS